MSTTTEDVTLEGIDDFLMMPDADSIVIPTEEEKKPGMFTPSENSLEFFEETETIDDIDDDTPIVEKPGRKKIDKSGMVEVFSKLITSVNVKWSLLLALWFAFTLFIKSSCADTFEVAAKAINTAANNGFNFKLFSKFKYIFTHCHIIGNIGIGNPRF